MGIDAKMFIVVNAPQSQTEVKMLSCDMCEAFGAERFWISKTNDFGEPHHALRIINQYTQDGPDVLPMPGKIFIEVCLTTRYYGLGYERGDFSFIYTLAEYLERKTGGVVWYGGDSSGVLAKPFRKADRDKLMQHFIQYGHKPYRTAFGQDFKKVCDFCEIPMVQYGWGNKGQYIALICNGCGEDLISDNGGKTFNKRK